MTEQRARAHAMAMALHHVSLAREADRVTDANHELLAALAWIREIAEAPPPEVQRPLIRALLGLLAAVLSADGGELGGVQHWLGEAIRENEPEEDEA